MSKRILMLSPEDRRAVDVILDHGGLSSVTKISTGVSPKRIAAVTCLLHRLNAMPEVEPPSDLIARTMARIEQDNARVRVSAPFTSSSTTHLH